MTDNTAEKLQLVKYPRRILSFVRRDGRLTQGQRLALENVWPIFGLQFQPEPADLSQIFGRTAPVTLEIGFGNGQSLAAMAAADPERDFIGIEVYRAGVGHLMASIDNQQLTNVRAIEHDAIEVLQKMLPENSLDRVQLFFPDPWHKRRHHKRRIVNEAFLDLIARALKPGGHFHMATDWEHYAFWALERLQADKRWVNQAESGDFIPRPEIRPLTKFEQRGHRLQHGVWDLLFKLEK